MLAIVSLSVLGLFSMMAGLFKTNLKVVLSLIVLVMIGLLFANTMSWDTNTVFYGMLKMDNYAVAFTGSLILVLSLLFLLSEFYFPHIKQYVTERYSLLLFSLVGMICMVSFSDLTMLFVGIEVMSVPLYILAGSEKKNLLSNEASLKYFLMGAFATGILLMGIALVYGATGSFNLEEIYTYFVAHPNPNNIAKVGVIFLIAALAFKVSTVPFHFWTPDVYQGAPTFVTSFMATMVKIAGFGAFFRLFSVSFGPMSEFWMPILGSLAALTMTVGTITAVYQTNIKRLLAYSSISHAGYMLVSILFCAKGDGNTVLYYTLAYALGSVLTFAVVMAVEHYTKSTEISALNGLVKTNPFLAIMLAAGVASLAGLPPTSGFLAKFMILKASMDGGYIWLALFGIVNAIIGIFYYFKLIIAAFFKEPAADAVEVETSSAFKFVLFLLAGLVLALGVFPDVVYTLLK